MSTKIFNGFRVPSEGLLTKASALRKPILRQGMDYARPMLALVALHLWGSTAPEGVSRLEHTCLTMTRGLVKPEDLILTDLTPDRGARALLSAVNVGFSSGRINQRTPALDLSVSSTFLADPDDDDWTYALLYNEQGRYEDVWREHLGAQHWPYWNNTDRPDDLTEAQWEERRQTWDRVLGADSPADRGVTWELSSLSWDMELIMRANENGLSPAAVAEVVSGIDKRSRPAQWWVEALSKPLD